MDKLCIGFVIASCLLVTPAAAQQVDAQKLIATLQKQRNDAADREALATVRAEAAEAKAMQLQAELEKLKTNRSKEEE